MRPLPRRETSVPDIIQTAKFKDTKTLTDNVDILAEDTVAAQHDDQLSMLPARREEKGQIKGQNISGGNWYKLGVNHFVLAFVFSIYFFYLVEAVNGTGKGRSTGTFCSSSSYEVNIDGRSLSTNMLREVVSLIWAVSAI